MKYVSVFYEGAHNDARTNTALALTAMTKGATVLNYMRADELLFNEKTGKCEGALCTDLSDRANLVDDVKIRAKKVIFCGGPYTDGLREMEERSSEEPFKKVVNGSGGTHIVLPQYYCPRGLGLVDMMTSRGSFLFFLPWQGYTLVGTTDVKNPNPKLHNKVPEDEVQYLINECEKYLSPHLKVRRRDVMSAWYGTRPLCVDPNAKDQSSVSRDHLVSHHPENGITFVSGGKWTTYREMAEDCLDQVLEREPELQGKAGPCVTLKTPLVGAGKTDAHCNGYHDNIKVLLCQGYDLAPDVAEHLSRTYGTRANEVLEYVDPARVTESRTGMYKHYRRIFDGAAMTLYPYLDAEIRYAVTHEHACTAADILCRRTRLAFLNSTATQLSVEKVVDIMGDMLEWSTDRKKMEIEQTHKVLQRDFLGPIPNKKNALLRAACVTDVQEAFNLADSTKQGKIPASVVAEVAKELKFPFRSMTEESSAIREMDPEDTGYVTFFRFLNWWNHGEETLFRTRSLKGSFTESHPSAF